MRVRVLAVGKGASPWADEAVSDWTRRLRRHGRIEEVRLRPEPFKGDVDAVRSREAERMLKRVGERDLLIALDERGDDLDTAAFARLLDRGRQSGAPWIAFAIGGPYGLDASVRQRARHTVRLSSLVLNHEVARLVLYEQLYRAAKIIAGEPYHH